MSTLREKFTCPKCGSTWVSVKLKLYFNQPVTGLLQKQLLMVGGGKKVILICARCKHEWKPSEID